VPSQSGQFVVCDDEKLSSLEQEPKVLDCQEDCQQLPVKSGVPLLSRRQLFGKESQGFPGHFQLQHEKRRRLLPMKAVPKMKDEPEELP
jgi:tRNA(Leu) C34 or U34 (ribose-2'-O)-methylase TrmL